MPAKTDKARVPCSLCLKKGNEVIHNPDIKGAGNNVGNSQTLGRRLMKKFYGNRPQISHPLSTPEATAQAHHLICSVAMKSKEWGKVCSNFGYDINHTKNGILLPADMRIACQLSIPLHRGNHSKGDGGESPNYTAGVKSKIDPFKDAAIRGELCEEGEDIIADLNNKSKEIWSLIKGFVWTLTFDGRDYAGAIGCLGKTTLPEKRKVMGEGKVLTCPDGKSHIITVLQPSLIEQ